MPRDDLTELPEGWIFFCWTLLAAVVAYGYPLTNFALHIDEEAAAVIGAFGPRIATGRWGVALVRATLLPDPAVPFFLPLLSLACLSAAAMAAACAVRLRSADKYIFCLLFVTLPQFAYQMEFINQADCIAFGILCAALAYLAFVKAGATTPRNRMMWILVSTVLLMLAISFYQTIVFVYATICILACLNRAVMNSSSVRSIFLHAAIAILIVMAAYLAYELITDLLRNTVISAEERDDALGYLSDLWGWHRADIWPQILAVCVATWADFVGASFYGNAIYATVLIPLAAIVAAAIVAGLPLYRIGLVAALAVAAIVCPFANLLILGQQQDPRTFVAEASAFAGIWAIAMSRMTRTPRFLQLVIVAISLFYGSLHISRLFFSDSMAWQADKALGNRIVSAISFSDPEFDPARTPVYFAGGYAPQNIWEGDDFDVFGKSFFAWSGGDTNRILAFLEASGIATFRAPYPSELTGVTPQIATLPTWPNPHAVKLIDSVMVVKLGDR
jgi:hypothetical protein